MANYGYGSNLADINRIRIHTGKYVSTLFAYRLSFGEAGFSAEDYSKELDDLNTTSKSATGSTTRLINIMILITA